MTTMRAATLVDVIGSAAIITQADRGGVSLSISTHYLAPMPIGDVSTGAPWAAHEAPQCCFAHGAGAPLPPGSCQHQCMHTAGAGWHACPHNVQRVRCTSINNYAGGGNRGNCGKGGWGCAPQTVFA
jgi:hypothetical protein